MKQDNVYFENRKEFYHSLQHRLHCSLATQLVTMSVFLAEPGNTLLTWYQMDLQGHISGYDAGANSCIYSAGALRRICAHA